MLYSKEEKRRLLYDNTNDKTADSADSSFRNPSYINCKKQRYGDIFHAG